MKRLCLLLACYLLLLGCGGCRPQVDYGQSACYSQDDLAAAAAVISQQLADMPGCRLYALTYQGDAVSQDNLDYCNSLSSGPVYTECVVFGSRFRSPRQGGGAWQKNAIYTWTWYLARESQGDWQLLTWGYC